MGSAQTPEAPAPTAAYKVIAIDPDGDLYLHVLDTDAPSTLWKFRVCSAALRRRSPVWKQMLFGPWKERKPTSSGKDWIVELFDDCPQAMQMILHIVHGNFDMVPSLFLSLRQLHDLLVVANKYDMVNVIKPWSQGWASVAQGPMTEAEDTIKSFYVAWQLGDKNLFAQRLQEIAVLSYIDGKGRLVLRKEVGLFGPKPTQCILEDVDHIGPEDILRTITKIRAKLIEAIIQPVHEDLRARLQVLPACSFNCRPNQDEDAGSPQLCDAAIVGGIHSGMLRWVGSLLPKQHADIVDSVVGLASWLFLCMTNVETIPRHRKTCSIAQKYTNLSINVHVSIPTVVERYITPSYHTYMEKARVKTGLAMKGPDTATYAYWGEPSLGKNFFDRISTPATSMFGAPIPTRSAAPATATVAAPTGSAPPPSTLFGTAPPTTTANAAGGQSWW